MKKIATILVAALMITLVGCSNFNSPTSSEAEGQNEFDNITINKTQSGVPEIG